MITADLIAEFIVRAGVIYLAAFLTDRGEKLGGFSGKVAYFSSMALLMSVFHTGL